MWRMRSNDLIYDLDQEERAQSQEEEQREEQSLEDSERPRSQRSQRCLLPPGDIRSFFSVRQGQF